MPIYAKSILQATIHEKPRVVEALLSTTAQDPTQRQLLLSEMDSENQRTIVMYSAFLNQLDSLELLSASDAYFNQTDRYHRTALHYAAMNDSSKLIETVFMGFKAGAL